jgi:hypothetical protein
MHTQRFNIPRGDAGTRATLDKMREVARWAATRPEVRGLAAVLVDPLGLEYFLRAHVRFARDPEGVEKIRNPVKLLYEIGEAAVGRGDCDDLATLAASVLLAMGRRPAFVVVGRGDRFEHVYYGTIEPDGSLIPYDPQQRTPPGEHTAAGEIRRRDVVAV